MLPFAIPGEAHATEPDDVDDVAAAAPSTDDAKADGDEASEHKATKPVSKHKALPGKKKVAKAHKKDKDKVVASKKTKTKKVAVKDKKKPKKDKVHGSSDRLAKADPPKKDKSSVVLSKGVKNDSAAKADSEPSHDKDHKKKPRRPLKRRIKDEPKDD